MILVLLCTHVVSGNENEVDDIPNTSVDTWRRECFRAIHANHDGDLSLQYGKGRHNGQTMYHVKKLGEKH